MLFLLNTMVSRSFGKLTLWQVAPLLRTTTPIRDNAQTWESNPYQGQRPLLATMRLSFLKLFRFVGHEVCDEPDRLTKRTWRQGWRILHKHKRIGWSSLQRVALNKRPVKRLVFIQSVNKERVNRRDGLAASHLFFLSIFKCFKQIVKPT